MCVAAAILHWLLGGLLRLLVGWLAAPPPVGVGGVGWLVGWLAGWRICWQVGWLVDWLAGFPHVVPLVFLYFSSGFPMILNVCCIDMILVSRCCFSIVFLWLFNVFFMVCLVLLRCYIAFLSFFCLGN